MKSTSLASLNAKFISAGGEGVTAADGSPVPERKGVGVVMDCPCGKCGQKLCVEFANPISGGASVRPTDGGWKRVGSTIDTLSLHPSVQRVGGCGWHGYITEGFAIEC